MKISFSKELFVNTLLYHINLIITMKKISTYLIAVLFCSLIAPLAIGDANNPEVLSFSEEITVEKKAQTATPHR